MTAQQGLPSELASVENYQTKVKKAEAGQMEKDEMLALILEQAKLINQLKLQHENKV